MEDDARPPSLLLPRRTDVQAEIIIGKTIWAGEDDIGEASLGGRLEVGGGGGYPGNMSCGLQAAW